MTASSATVEAEFKNIKNVLFKHDNLPMRVDEFIGRHLSYLEGNMRICSAKHTAPTEDALPATNEAADVILISEPINPDQDKLPSEPPADAVENWRGLALPPKKRKTSSYLSSCPEWLHADPTVTRKKRNVGFLRNGNSLQPVCLNNTRASVLNTCAFDAFMQSLCCAYLDSVTFQNLVDCEEKDNQLLQLVKSLTAEGVSQHTYLQRAQLLSTLFESALLRSGTLQIDAQCNITAIIQKTMRNIASVYARKKCSSVHCQLNRPVTREVPLVCPSIAVLQASGMSHLQTAIDQELTLAESPCLRKTPASSQVVPAVEGRCPGTVQHSYAVGGILWIDTDIEMCPTEFTKNNQSYRREFSLSEFPLNLTLQGKKFILRAIIAYQGGLTPDTIGHYVSYCRRAHCVWELYDDLRSGMQATLETTKVRPHAALYCT